MSTGDIYGTEPYLEELNTISLVLKRILCIHFILELEMCYNGTINSLVKDSRPKKQV